MLSHQRDGVEDVDEGGEDLPVEVGGEEGAERSEEHHDGHANRLKLKIFFKKTSPFSTKKKVNYQVLPRLQVRAGVRHELPPVEAHAGVDRHQDHGGRGGDLFWKIK